MRHIAATEREQFHQGRHSNSLYRRDSNWAARRKMQDLQAPEGAEFINSKLLQSICRPAHFAAGDVLRRKGQYYRDMYLITAGCVEVDLQDGNGVAPRLLVSDVGSPIGEIGFIRGSSARATVTARAATSTLVIDDPTLARLEQEQPALAARLLRHLAETAEERTSYNLTWSTTSMAGARSQAIEVYLCRNKDMLESAQRLRYDVYCRELGRQSPHADHDRKIISDRLDDGGHVFVALEAGETIGTLRANLSFESSVGILEELYGMRASSHHPQATGICTKFIVRKSKRGSPASIKLISAVVQYGLRNGIKECYIDCVPALLPYYKALGFTLTRQKFFHVENGPSHPMVLDLVRHGERLGNERGIRGYLTLMMKAQAIKLIDRVRGPAATAVVD